MPLRMAWCLGIQVSRDRHFNLPPRVCRGQLRKAAWELPCLGAKFSFTCAEKGPVVEKALPSYAQRLDALHRALEADFREIVARLPLGGREFVVDAGCGDGFFTGLLAELLPQGRVAGLDSSPAFLQAAERRLQRPVGDDIVELIKGSVTELPFDDQSVDVIFSAHSMQSYPDIPQTLREFKRALRPGGVLAVLETDNIHSIMLSWPPDLELAVRAAEHREIGDEDSYIGTYFPRFAPRLLDAAQFKDFHREYVFIHRQRPADEWLDRYVRLYLEYLLEETGGRLSAAQRSRLSELADPASSRYLARQDNFFFGSLQAVMTARA